MNANNKYIYIAIGGAIVLAFIIYNQRQKIVSNFNDISFDASNATITSGGAYFNALNIKKSADVFTGEVTSPSNTFKSFSSFDYNFRAGTKILRNYYNNDGATTLQDMIYRYAPSQDNNTPAIYTQTVSNATGIAPSQDMGSIIYTPQLASVLLAMASVEQGNNFGQQASIQQSAQNGYNLA